MTLTVETLAALLRETEVELYPHGYGIPRHPTYYEKMATALLPQLGAAETLIQNLQSALVAAGHDADCPVVHGASTDCVPGSCVRLPQLRARLLREEPQK